MPAAVRAWSLAELLRDIAAMPPGQDCRVTGLQPDSRRVVPGDLFVAVPGARSDGRAFIEEAVRRGAAAVLYEAMAQGALSAAVPAVAVSGLPARLGVIADRFYGAPSSRLVVVGVTGTNGKTTCTQLAAQALDRPQQRCAVIGTLGYGFPGQLDTSLHTTPDAVTLHRLFAEFLGRGARHISMEVSSHALDQGRVEAVAFDCAVFTNLSRDHLDYHGDMHAYGTAKARLFDFPGLKHAVINVEDAFGAELARRVAGRMELLTYGLERGDVRARDLHFTRAGLEVTVLSPAAATTVRSPLYGRFNATNLLAVFATLLALGLPAAEAGRRLSATRPVPGRVEHFGGRGGAPLVVVDYAHTPDALEQVLSALRAHTGGRLHCVFGCGGDRDRGKRPQMGAIAGRLADSVVLTDDNPRHEDPERIIADIRAGMGATVRVIRDRRTAIAEVLAAASPEDTVLIAGKGHEDYQQVGDERRPYSDRDTVRALVGEEAA